MQKKEIEDHWLRRFKESFPGFPEGQIVPGEGPDFIVQTEEGPIGVELTRCFRAPDRGSVLREQESLCERIRKKAEEEYEKRGYPRAAVAVHFNTRYHFTKHEVDALALALADLAFRDLTKEHKSPSVQEYDGIIEEEELPEFVTRVGARPMPGLPRSFFSPVMGGFIPHLLREEVQAVIDQKNQKVEVYRKKCSKVWLLIVAEGMPSSMFDVPPGFDKTVFRTDFDRVFFLQSFGTRPMELRVCPTDHSEGFSV